MTLLAWGRAGDRGDRRPTVVLLHDWAESARQWQRDGWTAALAGAGLDVLACDLPGHANSSEVAIPLRATPAKWTASAIAADLQKLGVTAWSPVAFADAAPLAAHLAVLVPGQCARMVLIGADDRAGVPGHAEAAAALREPGAPIRSTEASELVRRARRGRDHDRATLARWLDGSAWPAPPRLSSLRAPVLLAVGTRTAARARAPRFAKLFDDAHLVTVPADEASLARSPELLAAAVRFLAEPTQRSATVDRPEEELTGEW